MIKKSRFISIFTNRYIFGLPQCREQVVILRLNHSILKDFKKYYIVPSTPEELYIALTNPATIQLWSGSPAEMSTDPGTEFSLWEGSINGKNISFIPGKKIEQEWYFGDQLEQSLVTIILHPHKHGTSAELKHTNIPDEDYEEMVEGWNTNYFGSLIEFYSE